VLEVPPAPPASAAAGAYVAEEPPEPEPQPEPARPAPPPARATSPVPPTRPAPAPVPAPPARATRPEPDEPPRPAGSGRLGWPLKGDLVARFGVRDGERHDGIDLAAPAGTPVSAAADGVVLWVGAQAGYGQLVILRHAGGLLTLYAHVSEISVKDGDRVRRGEPIARVGRGEGTGAPQVHFEVREGTRPRNPLLYLP
jgi:murein DD-endopeptidase MepM/ murein hydrolase activator NlpD